MMANIGTVYKSSYKKGTEVFPTIILDIRTITLRKQFTIAVNKLKFPEGKIDTPVAVGKEDHPDYHIWTNLSNRGESLPSVIVGNIKNAVSENGVKYKRCKIFDPFISKENIYFTLFSVDAEKRIDENHLYNVVAEPYRRMTQNSGGNDYSQNVQPSYGEEQYSSDNTGVNAPVHHEEINEDEIPF
jgi:uncharacterized protein (DUF736 family)